MVCQAATPDPLPKIELPTRRLHGKDGSRQNMLTSSANTSLRPGNVYSPLPSAAAGRNSDISSSSSSSEGRIGTVSRNGVLTGSSAITSPHLSQRKEQQLCTPSLPDLRPLPSPASEGVHRAAGPDISRSILLQSPALSQRRRSQGTDARLAPPQDPHSQRSQSCSSVEDVGTLAVMPAPGSGEWPSSSTSSCGSSRRSQDYLYLYKHLPRVDSETDLERLGRSMHGLCEGCFYYPSLDSDAARILLQNAAEGTYLVRDSSDPKFLFSLTVKTARGATSVRIQYHRGFFQLDCEDQMKRKLPRFETMLDLLDFHVAMCQEKHGSQYRWLESSKRKDMVVRLTTPRRHSPPSLTHLARVAVNRSLEDLHLPSRSTDLLPLPSAMKSYLRAYPFKV